MSCRMALVGMGYVGRGMYNMLGERVVAIYDPYVKLEPPYDKLPNSKEAVNKCDLAVVCVPTAMKEDGACDTSIVEETIAWLKTPLILIKSTIKPGTTDYLVKKYHKRISFSPEYMGEGKYFTPIWKYPDPVNPVSHGFMILGGEPDITQEMVGIFIRIMGPHTIFHQYDAKTAEVIKYVENIWGAMKVTFMNEIYDCCKALGVDFFKVREGWAVDPRVERMHSAVFPDARGFAGKCYPKDLSGFIQAVEEKGYEPKLLKTVWNRNIDFGHKEFKKKK